MFAIKDLMLILIHDGDDDYFRHDIATSNVDPAVKAVLEACIAENEADRLASNIMVR